MSHKTGRPQHRQPPSQPAPVTEWNGPDPSRYVTSRQAWALGFAFALLGACVGGVLSATDSHVHGLARLLSGLEVGLAFAVLTGTLFAMIVAQRVDLNRAQGWLRYRNITSLQWPRRLTLAEIEAVSYTDPRSIPRAMMGALNLKVRRGGGGIRRVQLMVDGSSMLCEDIAAAVRQANPHATIDSGLLPH